MKKNPINKQNKGVGLIEVLVSILVLGVGALGIATMQLTGLKYNTGSQGRSQAIFLANDMLDRLRANENIAKGSPTYNTIGLVNNASGSSAPFDCYTATCSPAELADFDKWYWLNQVETLLPFGSGQIRSYDVSGERFYEITLQWRQVANKKDNAGVTQDRYDEFFSFAFRSRL